MASSSHSGNVRTYGATDGATDGAIGPLSGLFTDTMESEISSNNNDDIDNGQSNMIVDSNLTSAQASETIGKSNMVARSEGQSPGGSRKRAGTPTHSPPRQRCSRPMVGAAYEHRYPVTWTQAFPSCGPPQQTMAQQQMDRSASFMNPPIIPTAQPAQVRYYKVPRTEAPPRHPWV